MNRYLIILGFVGATLFSACSTSDDLSIGEPPVVDKEKEAALIFEAGRNSEVPITLGTALSRGLTRTPLSSSDDINNLAVFCLATGTQTGATIPTTVKNNNWFNDKDGDLGGLLVRMKNVSASVSSGNVSYTGEYYYPEASWMKYNYYAYYPKQADSNVTFTSSGNQVSVTFKALDGVLDVIWGRAYPYNPDSEHATGHDPYCADYFRFNTTSEGPKFKFEHKLVHFKFFVKAADQAVIDAGAKVTDMYINNAIKQLSLILANKKDTTLNGKVTPATNKIRTLHIKTNADAISVTALTEENAQEVGYLMLPAPPYLYATEDPDNPDCAPADANGFKYYHIEGTVKFSDSTQQPILINMIPPKISSGVYGFEPGKIYNIIINIKKN